jgi:hypothetical protein
MMAMMVVAVVVVVVKIMRGGGIWLQVAHDLKKSSLLNYIGF